MIPQNKLSSQLFYADYIPPDQLEETDLLSYELGGIGLQDSSAGLEYQTWTLRGVATGGTADPVDVIISSPNTPDTTLFSLVGITQVSLAFDQNMHPAVAYVQFGNAYLRWYDATIPGITTLTLPTGAATPRVSLDDKRLLETRAGRTDIICAYIRSNNLYFLAQSDRFTVEYLLKSNLSAEIFAPKLYKIGMNGLERLQFFLKGAFFA